MLDGVQNHVVPIPAYIRARLVVAEGCDVTERIHTSAKHLNYEGVRLNQSKLAIVSAIL